MMLRVFNSSNVAHRPVFKRKTDCSGPWKWHRSDRYSVLPCKAQLKIEKQCYYKRHNKIMAALSERCALYRFLAHALHIAGNEKMADLVC